MESKELFCTKKELKIALKGQKEDEAYVFYSNLKPRDWRFPDIDYVLYEILPEDPKEATSWPFEQWRMDIIRSISLPSTRGHQFILAITNYFSKWTKAIPLNLT